MIPVPHVVGCVRDVRRQRRDDAVKRGVDSRPLWCQTSVGPAVFGCFGATALGKRNAPVGFRDSCGTNPDRYPKVGGRMEILPERVTC